MNYLQRYHNFDWDFYIKNNPDLANITNKNDAWMHWIKYGIYENRLSNNINDKTIIDNDKDKDKESFDWEFYIRNNHDLSNITNKDDAWEHWIKYGKNENRKCCNTLILKDKVSFDWEFYIKNNSDLANITNKDDAWEHWIKYGKNENRICIFYEKEKIIGGLNETERILKIKNEMDDIIFKKANMDWIQYINDNPDLKILEKDYAWHHWISHGHREKRQFTLLNNDSQHKIINNTDVNNTEIHHGRFGNLFFVNMVLHFISQKYDLKVKYKYYEQFRNLGVHLFIGNKIYDKNIVLTEYNYFDLINNNDNNFTNIVITNNAWFQNYEFCIFLKLYFYNTEIKNNIIKNNKFNNRYNNNNDLFLIVSVTFFLLIKF